MRHPETREKILAHIAAHGPSTALAMAEAIGAIGTRGNTVHKAIVRTREASGSDVIRVAGWCHAATGHLVALWGAGPGEDVPDPRARVAPVLVSSVFALGASA